MDVILLEDLKGLGDKGAMVHVKPGYARNYLLPRDLAVQPTPNNVKKVEERRKEIERQVRERREQQERMIKQLEGVEVHLERRANEQGHLFGSVTATDVAKGLQAQNFNVEPEDVNLPGKLDQVRDCMSLQWTRYMLGRREVDGEKPSIAVARDLWKNKNYDLRELLVGLTRTRSFTHRSLSPGEVSQ